MSTALLPLVSGNLGFSTLWYSRLTVARAKTQNDPIGFRRAGMVFKLGLGAWRVALACALALPCHAADVGGWYADQQKASAMAAASVGGDTCPQAISRADRKSVV